MSIQAVSNVSIFQALQSSHDRRPDLRQLTSALSTGDLNQTQHADVEAIQFSYQQPNNFWQQRKAGLSQLGEALLAGNTDAAQQAYDALVALGQNGPLRNGETFHRADRAQDFAAIAQALASGDLAGAQTAFAALASSFGHGTSGPPGPPTPIPALGPPGPPTPIPPQGTLPPGPPTLIPPPGTLPPGPPTIIRPPSVGGGPTGPPEIIPPSTVSPQIAGGTESTVNSHSANANYQLALTLLEP